MALPGPWRPGPCARRAGRDARARPRGTSGAWPHRDRRARRPRAGATRCRRWRFTTWSRRGKGAIGWWRGRMSERRASWGLCPNHRSTTGPWSSAPSAVPRDRAGAGTGVWDDRQDACSTGSGAGGPWRKLLPGVYVTVTGTVSSRAAGDGRVAARGAAQRAHRAGCRAASRHQDTDQQHGRRTGAATGQTPEHRFRPGAAHLAHAARRCVWTGRFGTCWRRGGWRTRRGV